MPKNIKESIDLLSINYWKKKQNIYVTAQLRNIREKCVIFKEMIYDYNDWNLPNFFRYYQKKKKKNPKILILKLPKWQKK